MKFHLNSHIVKHNMPRYYHAFQTKTTPRQKSLFLQFPKPVMVRTDLRSNHQTLSTATHESHCFHAPTGFIVVSCVSVSSCFESLHALDLRFGRTRLTPSPRESRNCTCPRTKLSCMMSNMINRCLEVTCPQGANCCVLVFTLRAASIVCTPRPYTRLSTVHVPFNCTHSSLPYTLNSTVYAPLYPRLWYVASSHASPQVNCCLFGSACRSSRRALVMSTKNP